MDERTSLVEIGVFMLLVGAGLGMVMQNLVLVVQNTVSRRDIGSGSALIAFFRTLGGAVGVTALGALLAHHTRTAIAAGSSVEHAFGTGTADMFLAAAPLGLVAFAALCFMRETPLGQKSGIEIAREERLARVAPQLESEPARVP
jgi:hypothetical protein